MTGGEGPPVDDPEDPVLCTFVYLGGNTWDQASTSATCPAGQVCAAPIGPGDYLYEERFTPCE